MASLRGLKLLFIVAFLLSTPISSQAQLAADKMVTRTFILGTNRAFQSLTSAELRERFARAGVDFPADPLSPSAAPNNSAMFLNERTRALTVRATIAEMDLIENVIHALTPPPIVHVEARFIETRSAAAPAPLNPRRNNFPHVAIYTEQQSRAALKKFEETEDADVTTPPSVTTISGRQARLRLEETRTLIYDTPPQLPKDTRPDADPTPYNKGRLPLPASLPRG